MVKVAKDLLDEDGPGRAERDALFVKHFQGLYIESVLGYGLVWLTVQCRIYNVFIHVLIGAARVNLLSLIPVFADWLTVAPILVSFVVCQLEVDFLPRLYYEVGLLVVDDVVCE